jgi:hypothetical protein
MHHLPDGVLHRASCMKQYMQDAAHGQLSMHPARRAGFSMTQTCADTRCLSMRRLQHHPELQ